MVTLRANSPLRGRISGHSLGHHSRYGLPGLRLARDLERHARLVALGLEETREAELYALTPEERRKLREDEELFTRLLDRISERRYSVVA